MAKLIYRKENYLLEQSKGHDRHSKSNFQIALVIFVVGFGLCLTVLSIGFVFWFKLIVFLLIAFTFFLWGTTYLFDYSWHGFRAINYLSGLRGELRVYRELEKLSDSYVIFEDGRIDNYGNLDFVVQKGSKLFVIEVKNHVGQIDFDGRQILLNGHPFKERDPVSQLLRNQKKLINKSRQDLSTQVEVIPILVFSNPKTFVNFDYDLFNNVFIIHNRGLKKFLESQ